MKITKTALLLTALAVMLSAAKPAPPPTPCPDQNCWTMRCCIIDNLPSLPK